MCHNHKPNMHTHRHYFPCAFVLFALLTLALASQAAEPHEPLTGYYGAKGRGIRVSWEVPQPDVVEGRDMPVTLVVTGATNPTEVRKPDLKALAAFDVFTVTNVPDPPRTAGDKAVRFNYKLRPLSRNVTRVPGLDYYYFNPAAAPDKRFQSTAAYSVPIRVSEPPVPIVTPLTDPDYLFETARGSAVLSGPFEPCRWAWGAAVLFGPLVAVGWFLAWRRIFPDARRLAQMRRSRAARRALDAIRKSGRTADPPATVANALLAYLRARFPLPESAVTPSEVSAALVEARVPPEAAEQVADVFRGCDRARFAPPGDSGLSLATDAEAAVVRLEELA